MITAPHTKEHEQKPAERTSAQKWARVDKIDAKIAELTAERVALAAELGAKLKGPIEV
jgi:hypothetical protein